MTQPAAPNPPPPSSEEIAQLRQLSAGRCVWEIGWRFACLGLALGAALRGPVWGMPLAFVAIGVLQYHVLVLSHEAQHRLISRKRRLNDLLGAWLLAYPFGQPFHSERARHFAHHRLVGAPEDPDYPRYILEDKRPWRGMVGYYVRLATYGKLWEYLSSTLRSRAAKAANAAGEAHDPDEAKGANEARSPKDTRSLAELATVAALQLVLLAGFSLIASPWHYFGFWVLPILIVTTTLSELREFCEHVSAPGTPLHLKTFRVPGWQRFLLGPVGFAFHAEHHLYPAVPHYRLSRVAAHFPRSSDSLEVHHSYFEPLRACRDSAVAPCE